jgi:hypothetical protein
MTWDEFIEKITSIIEKYGFEYSEEKVYWSKVTNYTWTCYSNMPGKPDAKFIYSFDSHKKRIFITYISVLYHFSPSGKHSLTSKDYMVNYNQETNKKFKWDVFEKWCSSQQETMYMARKLQKEIVVERNLKAANKDF